MKWVDAGDFQWALLATERFRLDAGTLFSMVRRTRWLSMVATNDAGEMALANNSLIVRSREKIILIETGWGTKLTSDDQRAYAVENVAEGGLLGGLVGTLGVAPCDVTDVVVTHLHIDHAGGLTRFSQDDRAIAAFPRATCHVQKSEWLSAHRRHPLTSGSYRAIDFDPLAEAGLLRLWETPAEVGAHVKLVPSGGHTDGHQSVLVGNADNAIFFAGDILPTAHHVRPGFVTDYDTQPLVVSRAKEHYLAWAAREHWRIALVHETDSPLVRIEVDSAGRFRSVPDEAAQ